MHQGKEVLGMRVTWDKRYITLGPVATLLGLAFRLYDPERLLGGEEDLGITCALVPTGHPGVEIGRRHLPLNAVFQNGPNSGKDVFMPLEWIIGGSEYAGKGWMMLMGCLAAGRSISLPTSSVGGAKAMARYTGAYARVRSQFKTPIGKLEGVEEALGRIAANCYLMDATRVMTAGAVDAGEKPAVISAIAKYHMTERVRKVIDDAMDIHGGKGICLGPNNWIGRGYQVVPVGITVEGANILTRSLIIFGQGAIRCHPYVLREMHAAKDMRGDEASREFDAALFAHVGHTHRQRRARLRPRAHRIGIRSCARARGARDAALLQGLVAHLGRVRLRRRRLDAHAGRLAEEEGEDFGAPGRRAVGDVPRLRHAQALRGPGPHARGPAAARALGAGCAVPGAAGARGADRELSQPPGGAQAARGTVPARQAVRAAVGPAQPPVRAAAARAGTRRETASPRGCTLRAPEVDPTANLEAALAATIACEPIERKLRDAVRRGAIAPRAGADAAALARDRGVISAEEYAQWQNKEALRKEVIKVDDFEQDFDRAAIVHKLAKEQAPAAKAA